MKLWMILETLVIGPLKLFFEFVFFTANNALGHPGWAIVALSLIVNLLLLPLYKQADIMQKKQRETEATLKDGVELIKKAFTGDERMMILQTYYRQNQYKPTDALKGSISLLLEIPFFLAAYQFLSNLAVFDGASFGPVSNLGTPDGLLVLGGVAINVLPVLMTLVNIISSAIYLEKATTKEKVQLYAMSLAFLIFLYDSPSGLVFYWTLNNIFSLVKNIIMRIKPSTKTLCAMTSLLGILTILVYIGVGNKGIYSNDIWLFRLGLILQVPLVYIIIRKIVTPFKKEKEIQSVPKLFLGGMLFITLLIGVLIPSTYIAASPQEYMDINYFYNPLWYIVSSTCLAAGTFLVWMNVFYTLADTNGKLVFESIVWILCGIMLVNYMFFGDNLGIISANLQYSERLSFSGQEQILNIQVLCILGVVLYYILDKWKRFVTPILSMSIIAIMIMSTINIVTIQSSVNKVEAQGNVSDDEPYFCLSKEGQNVVVIMLDRGISTYVPYIFNEKPELKEQFSGFTYYSNTISFGKHTNLGSTPLYGGYEYTPVEMNKRDTESLMSKHNEALKVMPVIFAENGYEVTVCDSSYANYQEIPDMSIFDEYPEINTFITKGKFMNNEYKERMIVNNQRNFFCFSLMKTIPICWQYFIYDEGQYCDMLNKGEVRYTNQAYYSTTQAEGISYEFMKWYEVLKNLTQITTVSGGSENTFLIMDNKAAHEPMLLQTPNYEPIMKVDNTEYDAAHSDRFILDGKKFEVETGDEMAHYHVNMAVFLQLGKWFDYLRENGVYDNTRIILVADHGRGLRQLDEFVFGVNDKIFDVESVYPLLMVKDFGSSEFITSTEFMTNADVPTLAMKDVICNPINPFTQKEINSDEKYAHEQYIIMSDEWNVTINNGNTFLPASWARVKDNRWEPKNWEFYEEEVVLKEYAFP